MFGKLIMLVFVVLGIGLAVPSTRAKIMDRIAPVADGLRAKLVPRRLEAMADQLATRVSRGEAYPGNFEGWLQRSYSGVPEDPWGAFYYLQTNRDGFTVGSNGPDGLPNTDDDITVTRNLRGR